MSGFADKVARTPAGDRGAWSMPPVAAARARSSAGYSMAKSAKAQDDRAGLRDALAQIAEAEGALAFFAAHGVVDEPHGPFGAMQRAEWEFRLHQHRDEPA